MKLLVPAGSFAKSAQQENAKKLTFKQCQFIGNKRQTCSGPWRSPRSSEIERYVGFLFLGVIILTAIYVSLAASSTSLFSQSDNQRQCPKIFAVEVQQVEGDEQALTTAEEQIAEYRPAGIINAGNLAL